MLMRSRLVCLGLAILPAFLNAQAPAPPPAPPAVET
jgi:hypothetical protein